MTWVVAALTVTVGVLTLFVLGLLRSHGELMRRIADLEARPSPGSLAPGVVPRPDKIAQPVVPLIEGLDTGLDPYRLVVGEVPEPYLLVAFLSTTCLSCLDIWRDIIDGRDEAARVVAGDAVASVMIVLKGREYENLGKASALAAETPVPVVFSGTAWLELEVPGTPYFALIATADQRVVGAGSAQSWGQLRSLASDGMLEISFAAKGSSNGRDGYRSIIEREDEELRRAGIHPGHPSLHAPPMVAGSPPAPAPESPGEGEP
jgi:hypothetical protein